MAKVSQNSNLKKVFVIFLLTAIAIFSLGAFFRSFKIWGERVSNDFFYPYLNFGNKLAGRLPSPNYNQLSKAQLLEKIKTLEIDNRILSEQSMLTGELVRRNQELSTNLQLPALAKWKCVSAEIVLRDPTDWLYSFTINKGGRDGIKNGSAVFTVDGNYKAILIGVIKSVSNHSAKVSSICSPQLKISGRLASTQIIGLLNAGNITDSQNIGIGFLPRNQNYTIGEEILTTGFEENIPPGLKIGNLGFIDSGSSIFNNNLYWNGLIELNTNLNNISYVAVAVKDEF